MNILILTARFGMGHLMAAQAIKEEILVNDKTANVNIVDFMDYMFPKISAGIYGGFDFLVSKCSKLYNAMNKAAGKHSEVPLKTAAIWKIERMIKENKPDAIVVTFPVCSHYITAYKTMKNCNIPMYTYITDITAHEEWIAKGHRYVLCWGQ